MSDESNTLGVILFIAVIILGIWCYSLKKENAALTVDLNNYQDALGQANDNIDNANSNIDDVNLTIQDAQDTEDSDYYDMNEAISNLQQADKIESVDEPILTSKTASQ